ncbi:hypothetical protein [Pseudoduganella sp. OTU4001]|uniref:hypothetical protein n=1 Tax=Pseudoduganella sp. OTU4001 TaxID=3043854 RepID=UPI00313AE77D
MTSDPTRKPNGDTESRVVRLETSSQHHSEVLQDFRDETRANFDRVVAEIRGLRVEMRVFNGMLFTVVLAVAALAAKVY